MKRILATLTATVALLSGGLPAVADTTAAAPPQMLLIHGFNAKSGTNCDGTTWKKALDYYAGAGHRPRNSMTTIGYYSGDTHCGAQIAKATKNTSIKDIAAKFANYIAKNYTAKGKQVDIVAHSMGGLITRVAMLGSAKGWKGFPGKLKVGDIVTLGTPHQGVRKGCTGNCSNQWKQMTPGSNFLKVLQQKENRLDGAWAKGTDWSLAGADGDKTVSYKSAIDKGHHADQKYRYTDLGSAKCKKGSTIGHGDLRELTGAGGFCLRYWHASPKHDPHNTTNGWSPLKTAFQAATHKGDNLPK
ncbi:esterase/lipase family protein [Sciscionella sediminilitoris]|uniref:esterase/lipase family protein n=1 Tax=Sciscionella sediminilitoris TaxID=1445613 RepID=UPI0004DF6615|nr:hypothetical protein [Sciscionella sp. SE31]